jgi:hypothetical protein
MDVSRFLLLVGSEDRIGCRSLLDVMDWVGVWSVCAWVLVCTSHVIAGSSVQDN